ncbi:MAG: hypothetical protein IKC84_00690, partial [Helicobacteraceae bacterium]|nr:hypothetical protein [Helicobacteraceae bacterium]
MSNLYYKIRVLLLVWIINISVIQSFVIEISQEEIESKPLIYGENTIQINGKNLYFKELQKDISPSKNSAPLKHTKDTQTLLKDKEILQWRTHDRFEGSLEISGVLQYAIRSDWSGLSREWILFFDEIYYKSKLIPKNKPYPNAKEENMPDSAYINIIKPNNLELKKLFSIAQSQPLIFIGIRVSGTLKELNITIDDGEWGFFGNVENISTLGDAVFKYPNKRELTESMGLSDMLLLSSTTDPYINLRQSPNGKILTQIYKEDMPNDCADIDSKGLLLDLGADSNN